MNLFQTVKAAVSPWDAAEHYRHAQQYAERMEI